MKNEEFIKMVNNDVWTTLAPSKIDGIGVFAIKDIPRGTPLFSGEDMWDNYFWLDDDEFLQILEPVRNLILDRTLQLKGYPICCRHPNSHAKMQCFMNHSNKPNSNGYSALTDIKCGEEITENFFDVAGDPMHKFTLDRMKFLK